jgi:hypothetical protein
MTVPSDVSATTQPGPEEYVTGPAFALVLHQPGHLTLDVVKVGYDAGELETWYRIERSAGRLEAYDRVLDITHRGSASGGIWDIPPGTPVCPGMKMAKSSTR